MNSSVLFDDNVENIDAYLLVNPDDVDMVYNCRTPLMFACETHRVDVIDCLLKHKCNVNFQGFQGRTALHHACYEYINRDVIERLIANSASGIIRDRLGDTPLHLAAQYANDVNIIHQLTYISDLNILDTQGRDPLILACATNKNIEILSALINLTPDINLQSICGENALVYCCILKNYEGIKLLLAAGAEITEYEYSYADEEGKRILNGCSHF